LLETSLKNGYFKSSKRRSVQFPIDFRSLFALFPQPWFTQRNMKILIIKDRFYSWKTEWIKNSKIWLGKIFALNVFKSVAFHLFLIMPKFHNSSFPSFLSDFKSLLDQCSRSFWNLLIV
jgi:hypothetical protein